MICTNTPGGFFICSCPFLTSTHCDFRLRILLLVLYKFLLVEVLGKL